MSGSVNQSPGFFIESFMACFLTRSSRPYQILDSTVRGFKTALFANRVYQPGPVGAGFYCIAHCPFEKKNQKLYPESKIFGDKKVKGRQIHSRRRSGVFQLQAGGELLILTRRGGAHPLLTLINCVNQLASHRVNISIIISILTTSFPICC